jgi:hypothetical protein
MILLLGIFIGFAIGLAFHRIRTREMRPAFKAACDRLGVADKKLGEASRKNEAQERRIAELTSRDNHLKKKATDLSSRNSQLEQGISKIRGMATRMKPERNFDLGGKALLPAPASVSNGQRIGKNTVRVTGRLV